MENGSKIAANKLKILSEVKILFINATKKLKI
jgi:hypothetical protein